MYETVPVNACAARKLSNYYGSTSGKIGAIAFVAGLLPGAPAKVMAGLFGLKSVSDYFTTELISKCTRKYTKGARLNFADGSFIGCSAA